MEPKKISYEGKRILLVEDTDYMLNLEKRVVNDFFKGCKADSAENGLLAISYLKNKDYDAIVSDYHMPSLNGEELYYWIKRNKPSNIHSFILFASLFNGEHEFVKKNNVKFVSKGEDIRNYIKTLEKVLSR